MLVPAPALFSMNTVWPHIAESFSASMRATISVGPPAATDTMIRTGFVGYPAFDVCARAEIGHATAPPSSDMNSRLFTQSPRRRGRAAWAEYQGRGPAVFNRHIAALLISGFGEALAESVHPTSTIARRHGAQEADHWRRGLLRVRRERPRGRAAEQRDERAALHSITSSARSSSIGGTVRPIVLAVFRLITSSNLVGCWTGRSAGFSPMNMR